MNQPVDPALDLLPDPAAADLLESMLEAREVMETILVETVEDGQESGRTMCGSGGKIKGPLARFPSAVELDTACPFRMAGAWHSHTNNITSPVQSLPDVANVVFGNLDASIVVGSESSAAMVAAANREEMVTAFRDALGLEVSSPREVVRAIRDGRIVSPTQARSRVRSRMAPLIRRVTTRFPSISDGIPARFDAPEGGCPDLQLHALFYDHRLGARVSSHCDHEFRERPRQRREVVRNLSRTQTARQIRRIIISQMTRQALFSE